MALILNIDTSTSVCSVALARDGKMIALKENNEGLNHSVLLGTYIDEILKDNHMDAHCLDAVAISMGPGSYTGLRIGVSMAKGVCFGAGKPLIAVPTLQALALSVSERIREEALYCPMIDAAGWKSIPLFSTVTTNRSSIPKQKSSTKIRLPIYWPDIKFIFSEMAATKSGCSLPLLMLFMGQVETSARHMIPLAEELFGRQEFVDVAYFEPFYLKDFIATTPRKK